MRPCGHHSEVAGGSHRFELDLGMIGLQCIQNFVVESRHETHAEYGRQSPVVVTRVVGRPDGPGMPVLLETQMVRRGRGDRGRHSAPDTRTRSGLMKLAEELEKSYPFALPRR